MIMEFISFDLSKKLKEKGFPQRPDYFNYSSYYDWDGLRKIHSLSNASVWFDPHISRDNIYFAPTISQVLKWLREEKKISIEISIHCSLKWMCGIYEFSDGIADFTQYDSNGIDDTVYILYDSYEQATLAGIEYCLDNLI